MKCIHSATGRHLLEDPCVAVWNTCNIEDLGREGLQVRFLLVDNKERCGRLSPEV
jgi:hypothetical protein